MALKTSAGFAFIWGDKILLSHATGAAWRFYSIIKGQSEEGESLLQTALREVKEEANIVLSPELLAQVKTQQPIIVQNKSKVLTAWFIRINAPEEIGMKTTYDKNGKLHTIIEKEKLQDEEIDWAGFVSFQDAEAKIAPYQLPILEAAKKLPKQSDFIKDHIIIARPGLTTKEEIKSRAQMPLPEIDKIDVTLVDKEKPWFTPAAELFVPYHQLEFLKELDEEGLDEYREVFERINRIVAEMPKTYEQDKIKYEDKTIYLHYFYSSGDWWILEKDKGDKDDAPADRGKQFQVFGIANLNGAADNMGDGLGEMGYISIQELREIPQVELDFHFSPTKVGDMITKKVSGGYRPGNSPEKAVEPNILSINKIDLSEGDEVLYQSKPYGDLQTATIIEISPEEGVNKVRVKYKNEFGITDTVIDIDQIRKHTPGKSKSSHPLDSAMRDVQIAIDSLQKEYNNYLVTKVSEYKWRIYNANNKRTILFSILPMSYRIEYSVSNGSGEIEKGFVSIETVRIWDWIKFQTIKGLANDAEPVAPKNTETNLSGAIRQLRKAMREIQQAKNYYLNEISDRKYMLVGDSKKQKPNISFSIQDRGIAVDYKVYSGNGTTSPQGQFQVSQASLANDQLYKWVLNIVENQEEETTALPAAPAIKTIAGTGQPMNFNLAYDSIVEAIEKNKLNVTNSDTFEYKLLMALLRDGFSVDVLSKELNQPNVALLEKEGVELKLDDWFDELRILAIGHQALATIPYKKYKNVEITTNELIGKVIREANIKVTNWRNK